MPQRNHTGAVAPLQFPKLTATRGNADRLDQLQTLFDCVAVATGNRRRLIETVQQLDFDAADGTLTVLWWTDPSPADRAAVDESWLQSGEAGIVRHLVEPGRGVFDL